MDSLGSLNAFVQAAEARSFTVAGRKLGVSSSAIGKAVARMEERLGVRLFHRSTRSIALTAEGALFLDRCRHIFSEIEAAELELSQTRKAPRGTLKLDDYDNPIQNVYITRIQKIKHPVVGEVLTNVPFKTYENVSQFWTWTPEEFLKRGPYKR